MPELPTSLYDPATGLANNDLFLDRLSHGLERASRDDRLLGLLTIELNDLGESERDALVRTAAQRVRSCIRKVDTAARIDDIRFGVIVEGAQRREQVTELANKIVQQLDQPFLIGGTEAAITANVGVTIYPWDATKPDRLLWNAETAMLKARNAGGTSYRLFDESHLNE